MPDGGRRRCSGYLGCRYPGDSGGLGDRSGDGSDVDAGISHGQHVAVPQF